MCAGQSSQGALVSAVECVMCAVKVGIVQEVVRGLRRMRLWRGCESGLLAPSGGVVSGAAGWLVQRASFLAD